MKVMRYTFSVDEELTLDEPREFARKFPLRDAFTKDGIERFRLQRACTNVHVPGFIYLTEVAFFNEATGKTSNILGGEPIDAWDWNPNCVGMFLDCQHIGAEEVVLVKGYLTNLVPSPFWSKYTFKFSLSMTGPINEAVER